MKMNLTPRFHSVPFWRKLSIFALTVSLSLGTWFWFSPNTETSGKQVTSATDLLVLQKMKPIEIKATKPTAQGDTGDLKKSNWFASIQKEMNRSEYFIREDASSGTLGSPNRKNNLRFTYDANGFSVKPRTTKIPLEELKPGQHPDSLKCKTIKDWAIRFDLHNSNWGTGYWEIAENKAEYVTEKVIVQYDNQEEGMRQNFVVKSPLEKGKKLAIRFKVSTTLKVNANNAALDFNLNGEQIMQYKDLKVWDADGKTLTASLQHKYKDTYTIEVDDSKAIFPITIDPISTTAVTMVESNQANAHLGFSVSGAGDVNGDGYSDVIVGAYGFDNKWLSNAGEALIYHGSATGISSTASTVLESNQEGAYMGNAVSSAGDINGDGYSDVIVGAYKYDNGGIAIDQGAVFIYYGSTIGINTSISTKLGSNAPDAWFGNSVSGAGDVNGDGYSDVIVGTYGYDHGQTREGTAFVYHGSATGINTTVATILEANQANAFAGYSVSGAGDVNGDGYSDVIIGAFLYDNGQDNEGAAFIFHGSASGINPIIANIVESNQQNAWFGYSVSGAGDVNGDGFSDVIVGSLYYDNGQIDEGAAFVYLGGALGISSVSYKTLESNQEYAQLGVTVSGVGDINGDGYGDIIVGANQYDNGQTDEGAAFVYQGGAMGINTSYTIFVESNQTNARLGRAVSGTGDVNGDGYSDVIVGAENYSNGEWSEGAAFVYHGSASGINTTASTMVESNQAGAYLGFSVSEAGDVNGDGYSDVIIGAIGFDNGQTDEGAAFVYHGNSSGISTTYSAMLESNQANAGMGYSVSSAGDVNGDGYGDVIVGARYYDNGQIDEGVAFVYHGSPSGINITNATIIESNQAYSWLGCSVSNAGDVNSDGFGDVIIGAYKYTNGQTNEGAAFVYNGSTTGINKNSATMIESNQSSSWLGYSVSGAGDVNGDGYSDVIVGAYYYTNLFAEEGAAFVYHGSAAGINSTASSMVESNQVGAYMGSSVSGAGDVNGDGYSDVIVGAFVYDNGQSDEGAAFVFHGSASGINTMPAAKVESNQAGASMGYSVSGAGDVNGDGYSDVIVGAYLYDNNEADEGAVFIYYGSATGISINVPTILESNQSYAQLGNSVSIAGDVNGDGYGDLIIGAPNYSHGENSEGAAFVYLGNCGGSHAAANNIRAFNADVSTIINQTNISQNSFGAGIFAKSFQGKTKGKLVWEVVGNGSPFSGAPSIGNSVSNTNQQSSFTDLGLTGVSLANAITKTSNKTNKVRVRIKYDLVTSLNGQVYGPWRYLYAGNDLQTIVKQTAANTVGSASSTPSLCIGTPLTNITHSTTGATGIGVATGIPAGVTAAWANNMITISGRPTAAGTFNYSIPLTGGSGSVNATGTITVTAANTVSNALITQTLCINKVTRNLAHYTTGATGIGIATGLPAGVTASWESNTIYILGTPTETGTFNYTIPLTSGCGNINANGTIFVKETITVGEASLKPTLLINTALPTITHATTIANGIIQAYYLPNGVYASWTNNMIFIFGKPTVSGTFNYIINLAGGCDSVSAIGNITVNLSNALPVSGIELNGTTNDKHVKLNFKAINEREMASYEIGRSIDGIIFTKIGLQKPINGSQTSADYSFVDNQQIVGSNYYRIKGTSINGQTQFSNVVLVKTGVNVASVTVVPNPVEGHALNLKLSQLLKGKYNISITDAIGRNLYKKEILLDGSSSLQLNLPTSYKPGNYFLSVDGYGNKFIQKFFIQ
ncbi:MAG: FG-GAP-like repeat-containing protein [Chitinophagaceae bacterium]|nr:FG-GAP-like repeat-containing protein [Chitinophagaceae bacterium]